ncbi:MAG: hypothetical protein RLZZ628_4149 [Bacteroidota bacterium]|jgi:hypothetical protein
MSYGVKNILRRNRNPFQSQTFGFLSSQRFFKQKNHNHPLNGLI